MKQFDDLTKKTAANKKIETKIEIMQAVVKHFSDKLETAAIEYSKKLEENIQLLLDDMLTSRRTVSVSREFAVRVLMMSRNPRDSLRLYRLLISAESLKCLKMIRVLKEKNIR